MPVNPTEIPPAAKLLLLYELLAFSGRAFSLTRLKERTGWSRQTVLRLLDQLDRYSGLGRIERWKEGRDRYFRLALTRRPPAAMSEEDVRLLSLCRDIAAGILPQGYERAAGSSLARVASAFLADLERREESLAAVVRNRSMGSVDYTPFQGIIDAVRDAVRSRSVCEVVYHKLKADREKTYEAALTGLQRHGDSLYATGWLVKEKGSAEALRPVTFAIQRILSVQPTRRTHQLEAGDARVDFFGFPQNEPRLVRVRFSAGVDQYVRERYWSQEQAIADQPDGSIILSFYTQSDREAFAKLMSFGVEATVLEPEDLRRRMADECAALLARYDGEK